MRADRLKIVLSNAETQRIKLSGQRQLGINMSSLPPVGGNAYVSTDTTAGWGERSSYIPKNGEFVVYTDKRVIDGVIYPAVKIGDGTTPVADLPFLDDGVMEIIQEHIGNTDIHITANERTEWNNKYTKPIGGIPGSDLATEYIKEPDHDGTNGQVLATDGNGGRVWTTVQGGGSEHGIPTGGLAGDILMKTTDADYAAGWVTPANSVEQDNTRPITAGAVYTEIGNINALLATI